MKKKYTRCLPRITAINGENGYIGNNLLLPEITIARALLKRMGYESLVPAEKRALAVADGIPASVSLSLVEREPTRRRGAHQKRALARVLRQTSNSSLLTFTAIINFRLGLPSGYPSIFVPG
jgi:hypothetical protein